MISAEASFPLSDISSQIPGSNHQLGITEIRLGLSNAFSKVLPSLASCSILRLIILLSEVPPVKLEASNIGAAQSGCY